MLIYNVKIAPAGGLTPSSIRLARYNENEAERVLFDISSWQDIYGTNEVIILVKRSGDSQPYQITPAREENLVIWDLTNFDTAQTGIALLELHYMHNDQLLAKSAMMQFIILDTIETIGQINCGSGDLNMQNEDFFLSTVKGEYNIEEQ